MFSKSLISNFMKQFFKLLLFLFLKIEQLYSNFKALIFLQKFKSTGANVRLRMPMVIYNPENISIGHKVDVGENVILRGGGGITIGNNVLIAAGAALISQGHPINPPRWKNVISEPIKIGNEVWIGANAVILPGVTIGNGSIISAGAVLTKSVPAFTIYAGVPARFVRKINKIS